MKSMESFWQESIIYKILDNLEIKIKKFFEPIISSSLIFPWLNFVLEHYLYIFLFLLPFLSTGKIALLSFIAFILWFIITFLSPGKRFFKSLDKFSLLFFIFLGINIYATGFSPYLISAIKGLAKFLVYFAIFFIFRDIFDDISKQKKAVIFILLSTFILSIYCVYQWIIKVPQLAGWEDPELIAEGVTRVYGTLLNPNLLGGYLISVFPFLFSALFFYPYFKSFISLTIIISALSIIWTYSRGAYLGFLGSLIILLGGIFLYFWQKDKRARKKLIIIYSIITLLGLGFIFSSSYLRTRVFSMFTLWGHTSNATRVMIWKSSFEIFKDFFITGIGLGNDVFRQVYAFYMEPKFTALASYNLFLELAIEGSIFSLIIFLIMIYTLIKIFITSFFYWDFTKKVMGIVSLSSIIAPLFHGLVDTIWYRPYPQIIFWLACAFLLNLNNPERDKKALAFNLGGLGDQVLFLPVLLRLKERFKRVKVIVESRGKEILEIAGYEIEEFNPKNKLSFWETFKLLTKLKKEEYSLTISSGKSPFIPIFMYLTGAKERVGYKENPLSFLYTHKASSKRNEYMGKVHYRLIKILGIDDEFSFPKLSPPEESKRIVENELNKLGLNPFNYVLIHPGISEMSIKRGIDRRWEGEKWKELCERLKKENIPFIITIGPDEKEIGNSLKSLIPDGIFITPKSLQEFLSLIYFCKIMICLDSAPLHLGVILNKPLVALFGPTNPKEIIPENDIFQVAKTNLSCQPCLWERRKRICDTLDCMRKLTVEDVWEKVKLLI
ncbi:MAG: O-antigen ligase family protein [Dictyoglomaceae bacterium]|nr:O-antigen ligase family protein [Dictyoglomaceae bacterium]